MPRKLPQLLKAGEPEKLLRGTARERDRLMLMLALFCGLRVSEIVKLRVEHLDFRRRVLEVHEGKGKKDRNLPIPSLLQGPLRAWAGKRVEGPFFPSRQGGGVMTTRAVQLLMKRAARAANLPGWDQPRRYHPHALRHVFASRMVERGVPLHAVQMAMGHSNIAVTSRYLHVSPEALRDAMEA